MLEQLSLAAPREYFHSGLVLRSDLAPPCSYLSYTQLICLGSSSSLLFAPMIHILHVQPSLYN
jgi:hypothetical protein